MRTPAARAVDVLMATDLRFPGGTTASISEEVQAQARAGYRTGLLHIPSPIQRPGVAFAPRVRALVESGAADLVLEGPVHAKLLIVRHPSVLTKLPSWLPKVSADQVLVVANQVPVDPRAHAPYYDVLANQRLARTFSSDEPRWAPIGPAVREALDSFAGEVPMLEYDWTNIVDADAWYTPRDRPVGEVPVIGRHTRGHWSKWPADRETLLAAYPDDPRYTVQVLGGTEAPRDVLGYFPSNWVDLPFNSVRPAQFLGTTDFVVYYHHPTLIEAFGRTVLEGAASGAVTVVDPLFEPTFGPACRYAAPGEVLGIVDELSRDFGAYRAQSDRAVAHVRAQFSYEAHAARLAALIGPPEHPPGAGADPDPSGSAAAEPGPARGGRTLIIDPHPTVTVDDELLAALQDEENAAATAAPILLLPASHAGEVPAAGVDVETIPAVVDQLSGRDRDRYVRARARGILAGYQHVTRIVLVGATSIIDGGAPPGVDVVRAERVATAAASGPGTDRSVAPAQWQIWPAGAPSPVAADGGRTPRELAQRGVNLVRQRAPRPVIRLGMASKRAARTLHTRTLGRLVPAGALILEKTAIPHLSTPPSPVSTRRPAALFVITDADVPIEESLRAITRRAALSHAFRPVLLAPASWIEAAARAHVAIETLVLQNRSAPEYTQRWSGYLRGRLAEAVQAFQPAAAVTIRGGPSASSNSLSEALDVAEELSTQRTASSGTD